MCATICARVGFGFFWRKRVGAEDHARRAEAALEPEVFHEGLLERVQPLAVRQAFDGDDPLAFDRADRRRAGPHRLVVDQHRAGAAEGLAAPELGAGQPEIVAQDPEQHPILVDRQPRGLAVERE